MTKPMTSAQNAQQSNRTNDGKYTTKSHSEADVDLTTGFGNYDKDHAARVDTLVGELNDMAGRKTFEAHHNVENGSSTVRFEGTDQDILRVSLTDHDSRKNLGYMVIEDLDPTISGNNPIKFREVPADQVVEAALSNDRQRTKARAYDNVADTRSATLDEVARSESKHVLSRIDSESMVGAEPGEIAKSHLLDGDESLHDAFDRDTLEQADSIYAHRQEYHYGAGESNADELRSAMIVLPNDDADQPWQIVHSYGVHSETEAESRHKQVTTASNVKNARSKAEDLARNITDTGSISETFMSEQGLAVQGKEFWDDEFWGKFDKGHHLVADGPRRDPIQLRHQEDVEPGSVANDPV